MSETLDTKKTLEWIDNAIDFCDYEGVKAVLEHGRKLITDGEFEPQPSYQWRPVEDGQFPKNVYLPVLVKQLDGYGTELAQYDDEDNAWRDSEWYEYDVRFYFILPEVPKGSVEIQPTIIVPERPDVLDCKHGDKVVYANPKNGMSYDKEQAEKHLKLNGTYTIDFLNIGKWHTDVFLIEFPYERFNSVMFEAKGANNE